MMTTVSDRLDKFTTHDREVRAWYAEQDRDFWLGVIRQAAEKWSMLLPDCPGCSGCEKCRLIEALAWTGPADAACAATIGEAAEAA